MQTCSQAALHKQKRVSADVLVALAASYIKQFVGTAVQQPQQQLLHDYRQWQC
jgi:hypothetical protein